MKANREKRRSYAKLPNGTLPVMDGPPRSLECDITEAACYYCDGTEGSKQPKKSFEYPSRSLETFPQDHVKNFQSY